MKYTWSKFLIIRDFLLYVEGLLITTDGNKKVNDFACVTIKQTITWGMSWGLESAMMEDIYV